MRTGTTTTMHKITLYLFSLVFLTFAFHGATGSLCAQLSASSGSESAFMQQFVSLSFLGFRGSDIATFFDGTAVGRDGKNVINYYGNQTLYHELITSHVKYFGKLFNCTSANYDWTYNGPDMQSVHANLKISASTFQLFESLAMDALGIASRGVTTAQSMNVSSTFEHHRGGWPQDRICNEPDCEASVLTMDDSENLAPMFLNIEQNQPLTIKNDDINDWSFAVSDGTCTQIGALLNVSSNSTVTTSDLLKGLAPGRYYLGVWPRRTCDLNKLVLSPRIVQMQISSANNAPTNAPVDSAPVASPEAPVAPPTPSEPTSAPTSAPVNPPAQGPAAESPVSEPVAQSDGDHNTLIGVIIGMGVVIAVLLGVVGFLVFKLKRKEPHYEIIND